MGTSPTFARVRILLRTFKSGYPSPYFQRRRRSNKVRGRDERKGILRMLGYDGFDWSEISVLPPVHLELMDTHFY